MNVRGLTVFGSVLVTVLAWLAVAWMPLSGARPTGQAPPRDGYFNLRPVGSYASLLGDAAAATQVHRSPWEVRPENSGYNHTTPKSMRLQPKDPSMLAYDPRWNSYVLNRITGRFTGTTDEIFQWTAAKWGMPDNLLRAVAVMESHWRQANYGDYVNDAAACPASPPTLRCPVSYGIVGTKSTSWTGVFPWNRDSTAAGVDVLGGWLRGCYEGWVWWLRDHGNTSRGAYAPGDLWGCVGAWYSGDWHDGRVGVPSAEDYINRTKKVDDGAPWLKPGF
jgi:hypothetical protein